MANSTFQNNQEQFMNTYEGYLANDAYKPVSLIEFNYQLQAHACPCCGHRPFVPWLSLRNLVNASQVRLVNGHLIFAEHYACRCGMGLRCFAWLNRLLLQSAYDGNELNVASLQKHYPGAEESACRVERILFEVSVLICKRAYIEALSLLDFYQHSLQHSAQAFFSRALCCEGQDLPHEALKFYKRCLDLSPDCVEAWHNCARILRSLERFSEAEFNLLRMQKWLTADHLKAQNLEQAEDSNPVAGKLDRLDFHTPEFARYDEQIRNAEYQVVVKGLFGPVEVRQTRLQRLLILNEQIQGGNWLHNDEPDEISVCNYVTGFVYAAYSYSTGKSLVLGLGAGSGVIAMLAAYPELSLDVVEIDPALIALALEHFPKLQTYIDQQRLRIIEADALDYVRTNSVNYRLVFIDTFNGEFSLADKFIERTFLRSIHTCSESLVVNFIDSRDNPQLKSGLERIAEAGFAMKICMPIPGPFEAPYQNIVAMSHAPPEKIDALPFSSRKDCIAQAFHRDFNALHRSSVKYC